MCMKGKISKKGGKVFLFIKTVNVLQIQSFQYVPIRPTLTKSNFQLNPAWVYSRGLLWVYKSRPRVNLK